MRSGLTRALTTLGREALRIVLPSWCIVCARELPWLQNNDAANDAGRKASCCKACWAALPRIDGGKCTSCAEPLIADTLCIDCRTNPLPVVWCEAWGEYRDGLERVLRALKFERHDFLDEPLAELLEETLRRRGDLAFDAIVPVPMTPLRERRRGYNQATLLARALARRIGVDCAPPLLERQGGTATQSRLSKRARAANVRGAFQAAAPAKGKSILIVDDICTTGETLRACATALLRRGAERVCAVTVAKAK